MKFHFPSFVLGVATAFGVRSAEERLRPVMVELGALSVHLWRLTLGLVERQREHVEDLWAEVEERVRERTHGAHAEQRRTAPAGRSANAVAH